MVTIGCANGTSARAAAPNALTSSALQRQQLRTTISPAGRPSVPRREAVEPPLALQLHLPGRGSPACLVSETGSRCGKRGAMGGDAEVAATVVEPVPDSHRASTV